jgi:ssDNA-binding Zn-finger/Zn-ribbon topoisomerase 1
MPLVEIKKQCTCLRCGHSWDTRKRDHVNKAGKLFADVRQCPKCKSALWDKPKQTRPA